MNFATTPRPGELQDTYALFSGGRAVSESLQLDRVTPATNKAEDANVNLADLTGITVAEIDWKPLIKDLKPALDPLASIIPADQHAVLFPELRRNDHNARRDGPAGHTDVGAGRRPRRGRALRTDISGSSGHR